MRTVIDYIRLERDFALMRGTEDEMTLADQPTEVTIEGIAVLCLARALEVKNLSVVLMLRVCVR